MIFDKLIKNADTGIIGGGAIIVDEDLVSRPAIIDGQNNGFAAVWHSESTVQPGTERDGAEAGIIKFLQLFLEHRSGNPHGGQIMVIIAKAVIDEDGYLYIARPGLRADVIGHRRSCGGGSGQRVDSRLKRGGGGRGRGCEQTSTAAGQKG
ncbi:hypothetical protein SDC9_153610 [bioreactor metagenome]|uniref:Uncharacterized protein n=1 Tax=bioreactor metagenome TaxID=1076179 RepID=A0A645F156_9ZZZZ